LAVSQALFAEARSVAVGRGTRARVYIHNDLDDKDPDDQQRYLRYMIVAVLKDGSDSEFEVVSRGTLLPNGVFFDAQASEAAAARVSNIGSFGEDEIDLPVKKCYYYEFNGEGICVDGAKDNADPGAAFVVMGGVRGQNAAEPKAIGNNRSGFVVWRNGQTAIYRDPNQIEN
jgi:hypothetical protein